MKVANSQRFAGIYRNSTQDICGRGFYFIICQRIKVLAFRAGMSGTNSQKLCFVAKSNYSFRLAGLLSAMKRSQTKAKTNNMKEDQRYISLTGR